MSEIPSILVKLFPPEADAILARSGELVSDDMLVEISQADYGTHAEKHLSALRPIRDLVCVEAPMKWFPKEVLELVRWTQPDDPKQYPHRQGERGHVVRAFACAALLRSAAEPESKNFFDGNNQTLIQLIDSALFLQRGLPEAVGCFLCWQIPTMKSNDDERPLFVFGVVAIALLCKQASICELDIDALISFVEDAERDVRDPMRVCSPEMFEGSFLDETIFRTRHNVWRALAQRVRASYPKAGRVATLMRRIEDK